MFLPSSGYFVTALLFILVPKTPSVSNVEKFTSSQNLKICLPVTDIMVANDALLLVCKVMLLSSMIHKCKPRLQSQMLYRLSVTFLIFKVLSVTFYIVVPEYFDDTTRLASES